VERDEPMPDEAAMETWEDVSSISCSTCVDAICKICFFLPNFKL
jgi:hypothetical protein